MASLATMEVSGTRLIHCMPVSPSACIVCTLSSPLVEPIVRHDERGVFVLACHELCLEGGHRVGQTAHVGAVAVECAQEERHVPVLRRRQQPASPA